MYTCLILHKFYNVYNVKFIFDTYYKICVYAEREGESTIVR